MSPGMPSGKSTTRAARPKPWGCSSFFQRRKISAASPRSVAGHAGSGALLALPWSVQS